MNRMDLTIAEAGKHAFKPTDALPLVRHLGRRSFLVSLGGLSVGVVLGGASGCDALAQAQVAGPVAPSPNPWILIASDGAITIISPGSEMGQGTQATLPLCAAEELDADWARVRVVQARLSPEFGNPLFNGFMTTGASRTTRGYYQVMRLAGAQARQALVACVAAHWGVPAQELTTHNSVVSHRASQRQMCYGQAAALACSSTPQAGAPKLKDPKDFVYIGRKDALRTDLAPKTTGQARFGIDVREDCMVYAAIARAPVPGELPLSFDDAAARAVHGFIRAVKLPYGVGVLATNTWAAWQARDALVVVWSSDAPGRAYNSQAAKTAWRDIAAQTGTPGVVVEKTGEGITAIAGAARVLKADFVTGHLAHATLEPMNATALFTNGKLQVWAPTQSPSFATAAIMGALQMKREDIEVNVTLLGGGFGRRTESDYVVDAALLARAADGVAIHLTWSREDDVRHDRPRPLVAQHVQVGLDKEGRIVGWHHRVVSDTIYGRLLPSAYKAGGGKDSPVHEGADNLYAMANTFIEFLRQDSGMNVGFWRGVGGGYTKLAVETMVDEVAQARNMDPLALRLELLKAHPRAQNVLREVAAMAKWGTPRAKGRALGMAYSDLWETHIAQVVEVSVDANDGIVIHQVWAAVDTGVAVLPINVARQVEGGVIWGLGAALQHELTYKDGVAEQSNFGDVVVPRMTDMPPIEVKVIQTNNPPGGVGEAGLPPVAPAIANALAKLTGRRLRSLPFRVEQLA